jgi:predicted RNA-binding protein associated with RNAse of E/G family
VCDVDELAQALAGGQISANEAAHATRGLADLVTMI